MATPKLLLHCSRRRRRLPVPSRAALSHLLGALNGSTGPCTFSSPPPPTFCGSQRHQQKNYALSGLHFLIHSRSISTHSKEDSDFGPDFASHTSSGPHDINLDGISEVTEGVIAGGVGKELVFPVRMLIELLDGYHDLTGLPWWIVIVSSTVAMRAMLFPFIVLQLRKLRNIAQHLPKLPLPFPSPKSGRSFIAQISLFQKERLSVGCPSYLWFLGSLVQLPFFILWITSIRRMSLDNHYGFDCGGALWFQNLTEFPHGISGFIFPLLVSGLHYSNIQLSFRKSSVSKTHWGLLAKYYKLYLDLLTLPLFFVSWCMPQGSLLYWVTNSSLSVVQQLTLKHPAVRAQLGLSDGDIPMSKSSEEMSGIEASSDSPIKPCEIHAEKLSPGQLLGLSVQMLSNGHKDSAISLLRVALEKDPDHIGSLVLMGQALLQKELYAEAIEYLERAISKLFLGGNQPEEQNVHLLILASQWSGVACLRLGKKTEGIAHLERVASLKEPEDPNSKVHYFNALLFLASIMSNEGRKAEAVKYIQLVVAYNPDYKYLLEQAENEDDAFGSDPVKSRRGDY